MDVIRVDVARERLRPAERYGLDVLVDLSRLLVAERADCELVRLTVAERTDSSAPAAAISFLARHCNAPAERYG